MGDSSKPAVAIVRPPSPWVVRFAPLIRRPGPVLDVACGGGRHLRLFHGHGYAVVGVDIDTGGVADLTDRRNVEIIQADLEGQQPWPFGDRRFAGIVVTNYLFRPLLPVLLDSLAPGGVLIYETFAMGNGRFSRPRDPSHLARSGELLAAVRDRLQVVAYEHGETSHPRAAIVQRLVAVADLEPVPDLLGDPEPRPLPLP